MGFFVFYWIRLQSACFVWHQIIKNMVWASERRGFSCIIFSNWLRPFSQDMKLWINKINQPYWHHFLILKIFVFHVSFIISWNMHYYFVILFKCMSPWIIQVKMLLSWWNFSSEIIIVRGSEGTNQYNKFGQCIQISRDQCRVGVWWLFTLVIWVMKICYLY